jgi:cysteine desulfurase
VKRIYLDFNASTPIAPEVARAMRPFLTGSFGNPSSHHWAGKPAKEAVEEARSKVAKLLGCASDEIIFTSGGSESNNHALKGAFFALRSRGSHIVTTTIEHPAILKPCRFLESLGAEVTYVRVDRTGRVDPDGIQKAIKRGTILVSVMHANNEVGTVQPIREIAAITRKRGILFHTDAAQSVGKIPARVEALGVDLLSVAGHKLYAPKGVGALYIRKGVHVEPLIHGAAHEQGRRAGTENVLLEVGLGAACALAETWIGKPEMQALRDRFWSMLQHAFGERVILNGHPTERLPNTMNVSFLLHSGVTILSRMENVAASTGSACHAGGIEMSPVLKAMDVPVKYGEGAIRFSLGRTTTLSEIERVVSQLKAIA